MKLAFRKMNGAGNDFVVVDNRGGKLDFARERVAWICDRRCGVGADGFIAIESHPDCDFFMRFFNADGGEAEMCGNGSRCAAAFAVMEGLGRGGGGDDTQVEFLTGSGIVRARVTEDDSRGPHRFRVDTSLMDAREMRRDIAVRVAQIARHIHFMTVGTRHAVVPVDEAGALTSKEIDELGRYLRDHPEFAPVGVNVNFVSLDQGGRVHIRTYEKGVEAETHACGTGSVAAAVLFAHEGRCRSPVTVVQRNGEELCARFELRPYGASAVFLEGPAEVNFEGTLDYQSGVT
jgi:diaminopimelate epimerase